MEPELIGVNEAARVIGVGRTQLYKMLRAGEIPSVRVGKLRRIPARALRAYVNDLIAVQIGDPPTSYPGELPKAAPR